MLTRRLEVPVYAILLVGLVFVLAALAGYHYHQVAGERLEEAHQARQAAADSAARADSAETRARAALARADSLAAVNDTLRAREETLRDTLRVEIAAAGDTAARAERSATRADSAEQEAIEAALVTVDRPAERAAIRRIARADSAEDTAWEKLVASQQAMYELQLQVSASLRRDKVRLLAEKGALRGVADSLVRAIDAKNRALAAKDAALARYADIAETTLLEAFFGEGLPEAATTVVLTGAACAHSMEACAGVLAEKGRRVVTATW